MKKNTPTKALFGFLVYILIKRAGGVVVKMPVLLTVTATDVTHIVDVSIERTVFVAVGAGGIPVVPVASLRSQASKPFTPPPPILETLALQIKNGRALTGCLRLVLWIALESSTRRVTTIPGGATCSTQGPITLDGGLTTSWSVKA